ncbi:MAG: M15 family metallopeptidase [Treponema sp.]|jgi:D-alanyl-D-alanine carboxypeptidase|nr:M15 family metallopeptidase [Treponema sp.]
MNLKVQQLAKLPGYSITLLFLPFFLSCTLSNIYVQSVANNIVSEIIFNNGIPEKFEELEEPAEDIHKIRALIVLANSKLPQSISRNIIEHLENSRDFIDELFVITAQEHSLWRLVDKNHSLDSDFFPDDIVPLRSKSNSYLVNWPDLSLRSLAEVPLDEMAVAARKDGIILGVTSGFRTYTHQAESFARRVRTMGLATAEMLSARAGHSQHQLGLVVDFGCLTNAFARTPEYAWLAANASRFGFSLSYPRGYEQVTGYNWESWHYRYVGLELVAFIEKYFDGIQQYALEFIHDFVNL